MKGGNLYAKKKRFVEYNKVRHLQIQGQTYGPLLLGLYHFYYTTNCYNLRAPCGQLKKKKRLQNLLLLCCFLELCLVPKSMIKNVVLSYNANFLGFVLVSLPWQSLHTGVVDLSTCLVYSALLFCDTTYFVPSSSSQLRNYIFHL